MSSTRHLRRLAAALTSTALVVGLAAVAAPAAQAAGGCETDCIEAVSMQVGPDRLTLGFGTTVLAHSTLTLTSPGTTTRRLDRVGSHYQWTADFDTLSGGQLAQGTTYGWTVTATDQDGDTWAESGTVTTRTRSATVAWTTSTITDDSDPAGSAYITGASRANVSCPITALAPLSMTVGTVRDSGQTMSHQAAASLVCTQVPSTFSVYTTLVDDDSDFAPLYCAAQPTVNFFTVGGMLTSGNDLCHEWTSGSAPVASPLDGWSAGSATTPVGVTAPAGNGSDLAYAVSGTATFTVSGGGWTGPKPGAAVVLPASATTGPGTVVVSWTPTPDVFPVPVAGYAVRYRATGSPSWMSATTSGMSSTITGLANGTVYELRIEARDAAGHARAATVLTARPRTASTLTGWSGPVVAKAPGSAVKHVTVSAAGAPRQGVLVGRRQGTASFALVAMLTTDTAGAVAVAVPVRAGIWEYRIGFDDAGPFTAIDGSVLTVASSSTVTRFAGPRKTLKRGKKLALTAVITPGATRGVVLQYRKAGTSTWKKFASLTTSSTGTLALRLKAVRGTRQWRLLVPASSAHGAATVSGVRTITGR